MAGGARYACSARATWRSGYAAACKAVYTGSIPVVAFGATARTSDGFLGSDRVRPSVRKRRGTSGPGPRQAAAASRSDRCVRPLMADRDDIEFTYSLTDRIIQLS